MELLVHVLDMAASRDGGPEDGRRCGGDCNSFHIDMIFLATETVMELRIEVCNVGVVG